MRRPFYKFLALTILLSSCSKVNINTTQCEPMICTQEFRMIQVKFKDTFGSLVIVKDFTAIIKRTDKSTVQNDPVAISNQGIYTVASDADVKVLSEKGDSITITAVHPETNRKISVEFVVSGGKCACHINKISGPAEITL